LRKISLDKETHFNSKFLKENLVMRNHLTVLVIATSCGSVPGQTSDCVQETTEPSYLFAISALRVHPRKVDECFLNFNFMINATIISPRRCVIKYQQRSMSELPLNVLSESFPSIDALRAVNRPEKNYLSYVEKGLSESATNVRNMRRKS
jgi:hypothetical protein